MGVPKFFRWMSERYPCLSVSVESNQIPDFDCLYLDMNGIIHICSHPDDSNVHFRMSEDCTFDLIFNYIDFLFKIVKPKEIFFLAVDGVAPRAKMNQQRARRFKSAKEAKSREAAAIMKGEVLPTEKRFDSNAITPGTEFMNRLQLALKSFISRKSQSDPLWHGIEVILSGHETPGEGEHKILDFIRYRRSLPTYNPNTRHCLYGLDADLMLLGLASQEPYISLLREEVIYTRENKNKRAYIAEETKFYLLHLSLLRDYINYEFSSLKDSIGEEYDIQGLIGDWVLMTFLVGNDFIPHLPNLHIHLSALPLLWETYKKTRSSMSGYMNENGTINIDNLMIYLKELSSFDMKHFMDLYEDMKWMMGKTGQTNGKKLESLGKTNNSTNENPNDIVEDSQKSYSTCINNNFDLSDVNLVDTFDQTDSSLNDDTGKKIQISEEKDLIDFEVDKSCSSEEKVQTLIEDVNNLNIANDEEDEIFRLQFQAHKRDYYYNKLGITVDDDAMKMQAFDYVKGLQWISYYYFCGVPSWSWFYPQHYCPFISDILNFDQTNAKIAFDFGRPFMPFEQLMAVLPPESSELIPESFRTLITDDVSPIIDFYPTTFKTDLNGKKQEWEAIVLIPFIDEQRLLDALSSKIPLLTKGEAMRNIHGPSIKFKYYKSEFQVTEINMNEFQLPFDKVVHGWLPNVRLDVICQGFPTLNHINHTFSLDNVEVKIFESSSRNQSMALSLIPSSDVLTVQMIADSYLNKVAFVDWPGFIEAKVVGIITEEFRYTMDDGNVLIQTELSEDDKAKYKIFLESLSRRLLVRQGIKVNGQNKFVLETLHSEGKVYEIASSHKAGATLKFEQAWNPDTKIWHLHQLSIPKNHIDILESNSSIYCTKLTQLLPVGATVFILDPLHYGQSGKVVSINNSKNVVKVSTKSLKDPVYDNIDIDKLDLDYMYATQAAEYLDITAYIVSRITGSVYISGLQDGIVKDTKKKNKKNDRFNIGLDLKNNKKNEQIPDWVKKVDSSSENGNGTGVWMYTIQVVKLIDDYRSKFPEVFEFLSKNETESFSIEDVFVCGDREVLMKRCDELKDYLENIPSKGVERLSNYHKIIRKSVVAKLESIADSLKDDLNDVEHSEDIDVEFKRLYVPHFTAQSVKPDRTTEFRLLDRVVFVAEGHSVPLDSRGVVIGIEPKANGSYWIEVLFDKEFDKGISIRGSRPRCYRVPPYTLVDVSHGHRSHCPTPVGHDHNDNVGTVNTNPSIKMKTKHRNQATEFSVNMNHSFTYGSSSGAKMVTTETSFDVVPPAPPKEFLEDRRKKSPGNSIVDPRKANKQMEFIAHCDNLYQRTTVITAQNCPTEFVDVIRLCQQIGIADACIYLVSHNFYVDFSFTSSFFSLPENRANSILDAANFLFNQLNMYAQFFPTSVCSPYNQYNGSVSFQQPQAVADHSHSVKRNSIKQQYHHHQQDHTMHNPRTNNDYQHPKELDGVHSKHSGGKHFIRAPSAKTPFLH